MLRLRRTKERDAKLLADVTVLLAMAKALPGGSEPMGFHFELWWRFGWLLLRAWLYGVPERVTTELWKAFRIL